MNIIEKQLHFRHEHVVTTVLPNGQLRRRLKDNPLPCITAPSPIRRRKSKGKAQALQDYAAGTAKCVESNEDMKGKFVKSKIFFSVNES